MHRLTPFVLAALVSLSGACKGDSKKAPSNGGDEVGADHESEPSQSPNEVATETLSQALENRYSHRDLHSIDWKKLVAENREKLNASSSPAEYGQLLAEMLAVAKDSHVYVEVDGVEKSLFTFEPPLGFNIDLGEVAKRVKDIRDLNACIATGTLDSKTGYLLLKSFARSLCPDFPSTFNRAWSEVETLPRLVIDIRPNTGGDENLGRIVAARFVDGDVDYAMTEVGPPRPDSVRVPRRLVGAPAASRYKGDVRVLIGGANISSAEAFILMMKQAVRTKTVGAKSYGSSGNPKAVALGNGVTVHLSSWRTFAPSGKALESHGIEPEIAAEWVAGKGDPVMNAALSSF